MSTAPATTGATAATGDTPAGGTAPGTPTKIERVPDDIRRRILGGGKLPPPERADEKERLEKEAAEKKTKEEQEAVAKKTTDDQAAAAKKTEEEKKKSGKRAPKLPDAPALSTDKAALDAAVQEQLKKTQQTQQAPKMHPDVEQEVRLAEFAEQSNPERYKGMGKKVLDFYIENDRLLSTKAKELGGTRSHEYKEYLESDDYRGWVEQVRPRYDSGDKTKLKDALIAKVSKDQAMKELQPKLDELRQQTMEVQHSQTIRQRVNEALTHIILVDPNPEKDPALEGFTKNPLEFGEKYPEEARVIAGEAAEYTKHIETVHRADAGLNITDNESVRWIQHFMTRQNRVMAEKYPNGIDMGDGKYLVDIETYEKHQLSKDPRYRTWSATEMAGMIAAEANAQVLSKLKARREGVAKSIYAKPPELPKTDQNGQRKEETAPANGSPEAVTSRSSGAKKETKTAESRARKYG